MKIFCKNYRRKLKKPVEKVFLFLDGNLFSKDLTIDCFVTARLRTLRSNLKCSSQKTRVEIWIIFSFVGGSRQVCPAQ